MEKFLRQLQSLDRRWIYLVLSIVLIITLIKSYPDKPIVLPSVQHFYDAVDQAPAGPGQGKIILVNTLFAAGTIAENGTQMRSLVRHLMLTHKRFATISVGEPQGATYGPAIAGDLAKQYGYEYGKDWIDFGYQFNTLAFFMSFPRDIPGQIKTDGQENKPITSFPIMQGIRNINDVAMHVEITASASVYDWMQYVQPKSNPRLPIGYACTGVMAADAYPYLDSGQLIGMMPGLKGASDYEALVDKLQTQEEAAGHVKHHYDPNAITSIPAFPPPARNLMYSQSAAHIVIILFIIFGNVGLLLSRRLAKKSAAKEEA